MFYETVFLHRFHYVPLSLYLSCCSQVTGALERITELLMMRYRNLLIHIDIDIDIDIGVHRYTKRRPCCKNGWPRRPG